MNDNTQVFFVGDRVRVFNQAGEVLHRDTRVSVAKLMHADTLGTTHLPNGDRKLQFLSEDRWMYQVTDEAHLWYSRELLKPLGDDDETVETRRTLGAVHRWILTT